MEELIKWLLRYGGYLMTIERYFCQFSIKHKLSVLIRSAKFYLDYLEISTTFISSPEPKAHR